MKNILSGLRAFRRFRRETDLEAELAFHLEEEIEEGKARGLTDTEARRAARRDLGSLAFTAEATRAVWAWQRLERAAQDVRHAGRMMRRRPGFAATAVVTLALGIGANLAAFNVVYILILQSLPVSRPHELVRLVERGGPLSQYGFRYPEHQALQSQSKTLIGVITTSGPFRTRQIETRGERHFPYFEIVSENYFDVLGVQMAQGRTFTEPAPGDAGEAVAVISDDYWRQHYGSDPAALGAHFQFGDLDFTIVGIAPPGFRGTAVDAPGEIWIPFEQTVAPDDVLERTRQRWLLVMGRLRRGETMERAAAEATVLLGRPVAFESGANGYSTLRQRLSRPLLLVQLVVALVFLITCANLANLALAGTASRVRELAVRAALGASRWRLVRQLVTESLALSLVGGALAFVVAGWMSGALVRFIPPDRAPALAGLQFEPGLPLLAFALSLTCLATLAFGVAPALRMTDRNVQPDLRIGAGNTGGGGTRINRFLIVGEVATCTLLLIVAGVFLRSLSNLRGQDAGYREDRLLVADVGPPRDLPEEKRDQLIEELRTRAAALPDVEIAAYSHVGQLSGAALSSAIEFPGRPSAEREPATVLEQRVSPGFFAAMGSPITAGRDVSDRDTADAPPVAIVNEAFVRRFLAGANPLGQRFSQQRGSRSGELMEIVGVVKDSKWVNLRDDAPPMYYRPYKQRGGTPVVRFAIRTSGTLDALAAGFVDVALEIDRRFVLTNVVPFREIVDRTLVIERLVAHVSTAFGVIALAIAAVGLYGVVAFGVARRRREIGVRMAMGASARSVQWMILRESLILLGAGFLIGLPAAMAVNRIGVSWLYGLTPQDPFAAAAAFMVLFLATVTAAYVPARRASSVDPMLALREE